MTAVQIIYLVFGIIFCIVGIGCGYLSYLANINKPNENTLASKDWFSRLIIKNKLLIFIMLFVILVATGITFIVKAF